jgi:dolichol-phosphate mannosyltransferase
MPGRKSFMATRVSIVVPVFNEEQNVEQLVRELTSVVVPDTDLEILLVDDGSRDGTWPKLQAAARTEPRVRLLRFPENRGQSAATLAGLRQATGSILVTLDGDLQNNPADLPKLLERMIDADVVCGYRARRADRWSRRVASRVANTVRHWVTGDGVRDTGCSLKAFRRECLADLPPVNGVHRFMPAYFKLNGRRIVEVAVDHRPRTGGQTKYTNWQRLPRGLLDLAGFWWYRRRYLPKLDAQSSP